MINFKDFINEKRGLWDNIHAKRKRIENGSGEHMRKPGEKGAPTAADFKAASVKEENVNEHIVKVKSGYRLVSKKTGKNLGTYSSKEGAEKRERQVQYFKHVAEENTQGDIGTDKLTKHRKKLTPGQPMETGEMLPDYCECENRIPENNK